jgi:hypothetical protein
VTERRLPSRSTSLARIWLIAALLLPSAPISSRLLPDAALAGPSHAGGEGFVDVRSALASPRRSLSISLTGFSYRAPDQDPAHLDGRRITELGVSVSATPRAFLETFARFETARYENMGRAPISLRDGRVGAKIAFPRKPRWLALGAAFHVNVPWGKRERGFSTGAADPGITGLLTILLPESSRRSYARVHLNGGYQWHGDERGRAFEGFPLFYLEPVYPAEERNRVDLRAGLELGTEKTVLFVEGVLDRLTSSAVSAKESPVFLTPGFRHALTPTLLLTAASKISLARDDAATTRFRPPEEIYPTWQLVFGVTWSHRPRQGSSEGPSGSGSGDGASEN